MTYLYNNLLYGWNLLDFLFFGIFVAHILKSLYFLSIGSLLLLFIYDKTHGLSFHFHFYNVKDENPFYFEEFEKPLFVFFYCNFVVIITIPNTRRSLSSMVVRSKAERKFIGN
jgi:hypothetical protein